MTRLKVTMLAATTVFEELPNSVDGTPFAPLWDEAERDSLHVDTLAHFSGRSCYQAWEMPRASTATNEGYLSNIISQGHFSVMEHAAASFYIEGVSRSLTHELVRHRHLSYSQLSQRYVNEEDAEYVIPPALRGNEDAEFVLRELWHTTVQAYQDIMDIVGAEGVKGKKAREAARSVLPNMTETKIVVSGNMRAWRDMLHKRYSVHADAEILELSTEILRQLRQIAPATFQDFPEEPFE